MATKQEINFCRLLNRCELLAKDSENINWRLEKYIGALEESLCDLKKATTKPTNEVLNEYTKKVEFLKGIVEAEKLPTASDKVLAVERLAPSNAFSKESTTQGKQVHLKAKARHQSDLRKELLGSDFNENGGVRQRAVAGSSSAMGGVAEDIDTVLRHHHAMQDKLADEMVQMARNLKENAQVAGRIVQQDTQKLEQSSQLASSNFSQLKVESGRLEEHLARSCSCWIWVMLALVTVTFVNMVLFMRLFPKKS